MGHYFFSLRELLSLVPKTSLGPKRMGGHGTPARVMLDEKQSLLSRSAPPGKTLWDADPINKEEGRSAER